MNQLGNIFSIFKNGANPKAIIKEMVGKQNPIFGNLIEMAEKGDEKGVRQFAENICKERNIDFNKEFASFMSGNKN